MPVFRSTESMHRMIIKGDVQQVLDTNRSIELLRIVGVVIEPLSDTPVEIMPDR